MTGKDGLKRGLALAVPILVFDQLTKWWIVEKVMQSSRLIEVTPFFNLVMGWNRGISFGMFSSDSATRVWVLSGLALAIVVALSFWLTRAQGRWAPAGIGLVIGGALGNVIDRLRFEAVADFLDFHAFGIHWPAFNVADMGISIGVMILVLDSLFEKPEGPNNNGGSAKGGLGNHE